MIQNITMLVLVVALVINIIGYQWICASQRSQVRQWRAISMQWQADCAKWQTRTFLVQVQLRDLREVLTDTKDAEVPHAAND